MKITTAKEYDALLELLRGQSKEPIIQEFFQNLSEVIELMRRGHMQIVNELLDLYDQASEHNVDIGRNHILRLAQQLAGVEPFQDESQAS